MKLLLFFGSGISFDSGLPPVDTITKKILSGDWHSNTDSNFYPGFGQFGTSDHKVVRQQKFLRILSVFAEKYFQEKGLLKRQINYEDLYYLIQQIEFDLGNGVHNPAIGKFVSEAQKAIKALCVPLGTEIDFSLVRLAEEASRFIHCGVRCLLKTPNTPKGLNCLNGLVESKKISNLDIATLNHDLLIEKTLGENFSDGFVERDGNVRFYCTNWFEKPNRIRLIKLHGSVNWQRSLTDLRYFIPLKDSFMEWQVASGERLASDPRPVVLIGSHNKLLNYRFGIFADLHFRFFQLLREHKTVVMSGYSWNDIGINSWLSEWFYWSSDNRLVLLHHKQLDEIIVGINSIFQHRFRELVNRGQIILIPKWFSEISANDLLKEMKDCKLFTSSPHRRDARRRGRRGR
ncbi:MAG: SIR2 family protein [Limisphaerales bacterium]